MSENTTPTQDTQTAHQAKDLITPPVDVIEDNTGITLYADLPGVTKDKLTIEVNDGTLIIEGELNLDLPEGMEATHAEVSLPGFRRAFNLSKELDTDKISADFNQGLLKLRIPKAEHAQPRKITVNVG